MAYNTKHMLRDSSGTIIPQYFDKEKDEYEPFPDPTKVEVKNSLVSDFKTAVITVTSTPVELTTGLANKKQLIIYPPDTGKIYWGSSQVTSSTGAPLGVNDLPMEFPLADSNLKIYAVSDGTNRTVRIVEVTTSSPINEVDANVLREELENKVDKDDPELVFQAEFNDRLADIAINAKTFGAVANGINDDTTLLNSGFASINGGKVILRGTFFVTDTLIVPNANTEVELAAGSKIVFNKTDRAAIRLVGDKCSLHGMGSIESPAVWLPDLGANPWTYSVVQCEGEDCSVYGITLKNVPRVGIGLKEVNFATVKGTKIVGNMPIGQWNTSNTVHFGISYDPPSDYPSGIINIEGNTVSGCVEGVFTGNYGAGLTHGLNITNNAFIDCYDHGVYAGTGNIGVNILGNKFYNCGHPIAATGSNNNIADNTILSDGLGIVQTFGVAISIRDAIANTIVNNNIKFPAASGSSVIILQTLTGDTIKDNIITNNTIDSGTNPCVQIRIVNSNATPITKNNLISENTIKGVAKANFGMISIGAGNATASGILNKVFNNKITVIGAENGSWGILISYCKHSKFTENEINLESNAVSASAFRYFRLENSYENIIKENILVCLTGYGTNHTVTGFNESNSDKNEYANNKFVLTSTNLVAPVNFNLISTLLTRNKLSDNPMIGSATVLTGANNVNIVNGNAVTTSRVLVTPTNAEAGKKPFYVTVANGSFTIFIGDGVSTSANANYIWEIL